LSDAFPNTSADIVPLHARMTDAAYDAERAQLRETYGENRTDAGAKFEQALAALFHRSGWTQQELADKEGKSQQWIAVRLRFGRFLDFTTTVVNTESIPNNFTEGRFRSFWERTEGDERIRFREVIKLMQDATVAAPRRPGIGKSIKERYADGKWHNSAVIVSKIEGDEAHVRETLERMCRNQTYGVNAERKKVGTEIHYRLFKMDKTISSNELVEKLAPIIEGLEEQGTKTQVTMSVMAVAVLAAKLRKLLDEWTG
jgi:transcriptional regulator with XRE-family HTH domain